MQYEDQFACEIMWSKDASVLAANFAPIALALEQLQSISHKFFLVFSAVIASVITNNTSITNNTNNASNTDNTNNTNNTDNTTNSQINHENIIEPVQRSPQAHPILSTFTDTQPEIQVYNSVPNIPLNSQRSFRNLQEPPSYPADSSIYLSDDLNTGLNDYSTPAVIDNNTDTNYNNLHRKGDYIFKDWWAALLFAKIAKLKDGTTYPYYKNYIQTPAMIYILLFYLWAAQIITNVLSTTISGLVASYYYYEKFPEGYPTKFPLLSSLKRASFFSFGSICFGSLFVEPFQVIRSMLLFIKSDYNNNIFLITLALFSETIFSIVGETLECFNKYAYTNIAIYGRPFNITAKDTWTLVKKKRILFIINDSLVNSAISIAALGASILCAMIGFLFTALPTNPDYLYLSTYIVSLIIGLVCGSYVFNSFTNIFASGVATTFVCLASDPDIIKKCEPELYEYIMKKYPEILS
ncbi:hypothetical protein BB561_000481 [Smittium simulii]|uniref:Protein PNS1 n=1 Tax=Smittium simulii TaxID=133385 RepID=A0A2T9YYY1_9FUNG|nr:hypothetical protein BB561_000481 [Smittium simulii]